MACPNCDASTRGPRRCDSCRLEDIHGVPEDHIESDGGVSDECYQAVLDTIEAHATDPDRDVPRGPWGSIRHAIQDGRTQGYSGDEIRAAAEAAIRNGDLIGWHGLVAPQTEAHLQRIIEYEVDEAEITRRLLVAKCNKQLDEMRSEHAAVATDGGMIEVCPECDSSSFDVRIRTDDYRCSSCGATFYTPDERPGESNGRVGQLSEAGWAALNHEQEGA